MSHASDQLANNHSDQLSNSWLRRILFAPRVIPQVDENLIASTGEKLNSLAIFNEDIRGRCDSILDRIDDLSKLRDQIIDVFVELEKVLCESEGTGASLVEYTAILALEQKDHAELKTRHRELVETSNKQSDENCLLRSEVERFGELISSREARIRGLEKELMELGEREAKLAQEVEQALFSRDSINEQFEFAQAEIASYQSTLLDLQQQVSQLTDRCAAAEFHVKALERSLSETQLEHEIASELARQQAKSAVDEMVELKAQLDGQRSRCDAAEQLLSEVRTDLQLKSEELRASDIHIDQLQARVEPLEQSLVEASEEISSLAEKLSNSEKARSMLADGAQALVRSLADERAKVESANEKTVLLEHRLAAETARFSSENDTLQEKIRELNIQLEKEKSARSIASSALEVARSRAAGQLDKALNEYDESDEEQVDEEDSDQPEDRALNRRLNGSKARGPKSMDRNNKRIVSKPRPIVVQRPA